MARNNDGGGAWEDGGEVDGPRGKGMQDIAAPRDTRGRNLHDGAGDVLQSSSPPTTKSLVAPMYEWPILLGLSLGKSIYSDYRFFSCISLVLSPFPMDSGLSFIPALTNLHAWIGGTKISFFNSARNQDGGFRNCAAEEYFLHCRFLSLRLLITSHSHSIIPSLASDIWNVKLKSIVKHKNQNWRKIQ